MRELTERQSEVLQAIRDHIREEGFAPSVREIGERLGLRSSCTVQRHLEALMAKGHLRRDGSKARTLELIGEERAVGGDVVSVPLVGRVAAGTPLLADECIEDHIPLPADLLKSDDVFALRVQGDSMVGAGLFDGDLLVVRRQDHAQDGDIVVALVDGEEATVKRFFREGDRVRLQPENPALEAMYPDDVAVLGKAILSLRKLS